MDDELITLLTSKELGLDIGVIEEMRHRGMESKWSVGVKHQMLSQLLKDKRAEGHPLYQQAIEGLTKCLGPKKET